MRLDYTPVYVAFGIGLATYLLFRLSKISPSVKFNDVVYDKIRNEIHLFVENNSEKPVYVKPALRLIRLTPALEWKEKTSNGSNGINMMSAAKGSVIKGYDLIGEYAEPVVVGPKSVRKIVYPVMRDFGLRAYDNIKVDSVYGTVPGKLESNTSSIVRMNLHDILESEEYLEELSRLLDDAMLKGEKVLEAQNPSDGCVVVKSDLPIQAMCVCCGKEQWLNWVVADKHVCDDCKKFLTASTEIEGVQAAAGKDVIGDELLEIDGEMPEVDMFLASDDAKLKPRFQKIIDLLNSEATLTSKDIAKRLSRKEKSVSADLRFLRSSNMVERVKIGREFKYFSIRDSDKIILSGEGTSEDGQMLT